MADIVIRFGIYTDSDNDITQIKKCLTNEPSSERIKGAPLILNDGVDTGRKIKESSLDYNIRVESIYNIKDALSLWKDKWMHQVAELKKIKQEGYCIQLLFEIIVFDMNTPALIIPSLDLKILSDCGIDLAFEFYYEEG